MYHEPLTFRERIQIYGLICAGLYLWFTIGKFLWESLP